MTHLSTYHGPPINNSLHKPVCVRFSHFSGPSIKQYRKISLKRPPHISPLQNIRLPNNYPIIIPNISPTPKYRSTWINLEKKYSSLNDFYLFSIFLRISLWKMPHIIYVYRVFVYHHLASTFPLLQQQFIYPLVQL